MRWRIVLVSMALGHRAVKSNTESRRAALARGLWPGVFQGDARFTCKVPDLDSVVSYVCIEVREQTSRPFRRTRSVQTSRRFCTGIEDDHFDNWTRSRRSNVISNPVQP